MKQLLVGGGLALLILLVIGFVVGAIGSAFFGSEAFLDAPHVSLPPEELTSVGPIAITNTLLSAWVTTVLIIVLFVVPARDLRLVPTGLQNILEAVIETLYNFVVSVAGEEHGRRFFPLIATIFFFVMFNAWIALLPIYPALGLFEDGHLEAHLLRHAGTDINMPFAIAIISFIFTEAWGFKAHGFRYTGEFIRVGDLVHGRIGMGIINFFVGILELLSHFIRIVSFGFRLFGNMTAGEILILVSGFLVSFVVTIPFYGLEILVGVIQALIFAGLTLVFTATAVASHEGDEH